MKRLTLVLVLAFLVTAAAAVSAQGSSTPTVQTRHDPKLGTILTDGRGMTLYLYTKDTAPGQSACYDKCADAWPPLVASSTPALADGVPGELGTITRTDGTKQVTYNGAPLYYWFKDKQPGDTTGQGIGGAWYVVQPLAVGTPAASPVASPAGGATVEVRTNSKLGQILTDPSGKTLYRFEKDTIPGQSACYDTCAEAWPPFTASGTLSLPPGVPGQLGTITRTDGSKQVTYNGMPLYHFAKDDEPGDTYGQGIGGVWFVVTPSATAATPAS